VETDASLCGNRAAFQELHFLPRILVNTRGRHQKRTLFGRTYDLPFGFRRWAAPRSRLTTATGCSRASQLRSTCR
jgi:isopentenyl diphosphate isomerase/L-lactate dehydrogenase-like FMN-dependent dehydrogenase